MNKETLDRLLNKACEIITNLEEKLKEYDKESIEPEVQADIDSLFEEINFNDTMIDTGSVVEVHICPNCKNVLVENTESDESSGLLCTNCGYYPEIL